LSFQVVDSEGWAKTAGVKLDFDVNNLKAQQGKIALKRPEQGPSQAEVLQHVDSKSLVVLKPVNEIALRIQKMQARGWKIVFPH
jgi:hypothetical protein